MIDRNHELDWLDIRHDNWLTARHVHVIGWLLTKWCDDFFSGPFLPPPQLDAIAHSETIPTWSGSELFYESGRQEATECVGLLGVESVEVSVLSVNDLVAPGLENLLGWYRCVCFQVSQNVSPGVTYGLLHAFGAKDVRPGPYGDRRQGM